MSYADSYSYAYDGGVTPTTPPVGPLTGLRADTAAALAVIPEVVAGDWQVHADPVDLLEPPAYMVVWGPDPWGVPHTVCHDTAQLEVVCVSARLTPDATYGVVEAMVDAARAALTAARLRPYAWLGPAPFEIGQVTYLAARLQIRQPVSLPFG